MDLGGNIQRMAVLICTLFSEYQMRPVALHDLAGAITSIKQGDRIAMMPPLAQTEIGIAVATVVHPPQGQHGTGDLKIHLALMLVATHQVDRITDTVTRQVPTRSAANIWIGLAGIASEVNAATGHWIIDTWNGGTLGVLIAVTQRTRRLAARLSTR